MANDKDNEWIKDARNRMDLIDIDRLQKKVQELQGEINNKKLEFKEAKINKSSMEVLGRIQDDLKRLQTTQKDLEGKQDMIRHGSGARELTRLGESLDKHLKKLNQVKERFVDKLGKPLVLLQRLAKEVIYAGITLLGKLKLHEDKVKKDKTQGAFFGNKSQGNPPSGPKGDVYSHDDLSSSIPDNKKNR